MVCAAMDIMTNPQQQDDIFGHDDDFEGIFPSGIFEGLDGDYKNICEDFASDNALSEGMLDEFLRDGENFENLPNCDYGNYHDPQSMHSYQTGNLEVPLYEETYYEQQISSDYQYTDNGMVKTEYMNNQVGYSQPMRLVQVSPTDVDSKSTVRLTTTEENPDDRMAILQKKKKKPARAGKTKEKKERTDEKYFLNGHYKPVLPYACLVGLALKNAPQGNLSVAEIYHFVIYNFPFFEHAPAGWKNSIRHNLSLNPCFAKIEIETNTNRKACLWRLREEKVQFMEAEIMKHDAERVRKSMRFPDRYTSVVAGTEGMPPEDEVNRLIAMEKEAKLARAATFKQNRDAKTKNEVVESEFSGLGANPVTTVRRHAEHKLGRILAVKPNIDANRSVTRPVIRAVVVKQEEHGDARGVLTSGSQNVQSSLKRKHPEDEDDDGIYMMPHLVDQDRYEYHHSPPVAPATHRVVKTPLTLSDSDSIITELDSDHSSGFDDCISHTDSSDQSSVRCETRNEGNEATSYLMNGRLKSALDDNKNVGMFGNFTINRRADPGVVVSTRPSGRPMYHVGQIRQGVWDLYNPFNGTLASPDEEPEYEYEEHGNEEMESPEDEGDTDSQGDKENMV